MGSLWGRVMDHPRQEISERGAFSWALIPPVLPVASLVGPATGRPGRRASPAQEILTWVAGVEFIVQRVFAMQLYLLVPQPGAGVAVVLDEKGEQEDSRQLQESAEQGQLHSQVGGVAGHDGRAVQRRASSRERTVSARRGCSAFLSTFGGGGGGGTLLGCLLTAYPGREPPALGRGQLGKCWGGQGEGESQACPSQVRERWLRHLLPAKGRRE